LLGLESLVVGSGEQIVHQLLYAPQLYFLVGLQVEEVVDLIVSHGGEELPLVLSLAPDPLHVLAVAVEVGNPLVPHEGKLSEHPLSLVDDEDVPQIGQVVEDQEGEGLLQGKLQNLLQELHAPLVVGSGAVLHEDHVGVLGDPLAVLLLGLPLPVRVEPHPQLLSIFPVVGNGAAVGEFRDQEEALGQTVADQLLLEVELGQGEVDSGEDEAPEVAEQVPPLGRVLGALAADHAHLDDLLHDEPLLNIVELLLGAVAEPVEDLAELLHAALRVLGDHVVALGDVEGRPVYFG